MQQQGAVQDEYARKYADYTYRKIILPDINIFTLDPCRINPTTEYPRVIDKPSNPHIKTIDLADYLITVSPRKESMWHDVKLFMMPNEYTPATKKELVCEFQVLNAYILNNVVFDEALKRAFR